MQIRHSLSNFVPVLATIAIMLLSTDHWYFPIWYGILFVAAASLASIASQTFSQGRLVDALAALIRSLSLFAVGFSIDQLLRHLEIYTPQVPLLGLTASKVLHFGGVQCIWDGNLLHVAHPEGVVSLLLSPEKTGLRWMMLFLLLHFFYQLQLGARLSLKYVMAAIGIAWCFLLFRFIIPFWIYFESVDVLSLDGGDRVLAWMNGVVVTAVVFFVFPPLLLWRGLILEPVSVTSTRSATIRTTALVFSCVFMATLLLLVRIPEKELGGRVLIDDRLGEDWEPTARLLDREWFGDFSTYSFSSMAEWLGRTWCVDVNVSRIYTRELLKQYDILVLKTPEKDLSPEEHLAILQWTRDGGGLLLISDHTNLFGMSTRLNKFCHDAGIRFRYDSITPKVRGGFNIYERPYVFSHPGVLPVKDLVFMTSCSLDLTLAAKPILVVGDCQSEPHDYANSSFFGTRRSYPEERYGPTVLCASGDLGKGKVIAFTDSTIFSSFAFFKSNRNVLANCLINELNHRDGWNRILSVGAGCILLLLLVASGLVRIISIFSVCSVLGAFWLGAFVATLINFQFNTPPRPLVPDREVVFLWDGGQCAFPETLGSMGSLEAKDAFDTLFVSIQRMGLVPRVAWKYEETFQSNPAAVVLIRPVNVPPDSYLNKMREFVSGGGNLLVIDEIGSPATAAICAKFGLQCAVHSDANELGRFVVQFGDVNLRPTPDGPIQIAQTRYGLGRIAYSCDATRFSREKMGHCFAVPWENAQQAYNSIYLIFDEIFRISPAERRTYGIRE